MEYSTAEMTCILKVNTKCEGCKAKVFQVLRNIRGVYNITLDGEEGTVKVTGRVNPSTLLSVLEKYGRHAEIKYIRFDGEVVESDPRYYCGEYGYAPHGMECPQHQCHQTSLSFSPPRPPPLAPIRVVPPPPLTPHAPYWAPPPPPYLVHPPSHAPASRKIWNVETERRHCAMM